GGQFAHRSARPGGPAGGLALVAFQDADVVEPVVATGTEEPGAAGADRAVQPEPGDQERRRGAQGGDVVAPGGGAQAGRGGDEVAQGAGVEGEHRRVVAVASGVRVQVHSPVVPGPDGAHGGPGAHVGAQAAEVV